MPQQYLLAIDQGTTGTRAILYTKQGSIKGSSYEELKQYYPQPGWVEHDATEIIMSVKRVIRRAIERARISPKAIRAIGITNQRETVVLWDRKTGKPVRRAIVWQDRRTEPLCRALRAKGLTRQVRKETGLFFDPYFSGTKLRWLFDREPALRRRASSDALCFGTIDSWLLFHLTGQSVHATDYTNASRTLLFHIDKKTWSKRLLRLFHVPESVLPKALPSGCLFGVTKHFQPLPDGIPIHAILGDQQAALYGQGCYAAGTSKNTYGTGCFLLVNLGKRRVDSKCGLVTTLACDQKGNPVYAMEASIFIGGAAIQWLRDGLKWIKEARETESIARRLRDSSGVVVVPAFTGLGAPYWRPDVRGAILGVTRGTTREAIIKATLDSIALQVQEVFDLMKQESAIPIRALKVDGGATRNRYLMQLQADLLRVPILRSNVSEATAWGVAKLAGLASGFWKHLAPVDRRVRYERFTPKMNANKRGQLISGWKKAIYQLTAVPTGRRTDRRPDRTAPFDRAADRRPTKRRPAPLDQAPTRRSYKRRRRSTKQPSAA